MISFKMFVLRPMENQLVPSPLKQSQCQGTNVLLFWRHLSFSATMADFFEQISARIISRCQRSPKSPHCLLWTGASDKKGYGVVSVVWPDAKRRHMRVHKAAFLAYNQLLPEQVMHVPSAQKDVSHLCHSPMCVEFEHLNLEDHAVNNGRKVCHTQGFCSGHHQHPNCIF